MKLIGLIASALLLAAPALAKDKTAATTDYAPMQPFAGVAGKSLRGEWQDPDGKTVVDHSHWEFILDGRALQTTHRIENSTYGGRTIIFWDEAAKTYVFHYFTTGGFHTTGAGAFEDGAFVTRETVNGHPEIAEVIGKSVIAPDELKVVVNYVTKTREVAPDVVRVYKPVKKTPKLF